MRARSALVIACIYGAAGEKGGGGICAECVVTLRVRHRKKLAEIYRPRLKEIVSAALLEESRFFRHYQILRNLSLLYGSDKTQVLFRFPRSNQVLQRELDAALPHVASSVATRVRVQYLEDVLAALRDDARADERYRGYAAALCAKYLPA